MRLIVVGSNSKGCSYLLEHDGHYLCLDAGCKWKEIQIACGFRPSMIDSVLVSHEHGDHCNYYKDFLRNGIPVYSNDWTAKRLEEVTGEHVRCLQEKKRIRIHGGYMVIPFMIPHEDIKNSAFLIEFPNGERLLYATDFEYIPYDLSAWKIDHFLVAVNHSEEIPEEAVAREHRLRGHSSLQTVKDFLKTSMTDKCKTVIACHLSNQYANPERIESELKEVCGDTVNVFIADKGMKINL